MPDAHVHRLADANPVEPGGDPVSGRRLLMFNGDIEVSVCKPTEALDGFYRNGEGDEVVYIHRGSGVLRTVFGRVPFRERDYVVIPRGTTHTLRAARGRGAVLDLLPHARRDRDAEPLPQPLRPAARARAVLAARLPPARGARDLRRERRVPGDPARPRRLPGLRARPPPVRRRRLGRLRVAVHVQRRRLRAARRPLPPAAAGPPDLPGAELRHLHVRAADARLGPAGGAAPLPPLEHPVRGGHVLRRRRLRRAQGRGHRLPDAAPVRAAARAAARRGGEGARQAVARTSSR